MATINNDEWEPVSSQYNTNQTDDEWEPVGAVTGASNEDIVRQAINQPILTTLGGQKALDVLNKAGEAYDIYSGSRALRKGVSEALKQAETPAGFGPAGMISTVGKTLAETYGKPIEAPTSREILQETEFGRSLPEWAQTAGGIAGDILLDPSLLVPTGAISRIAKTGLEAGEIGAMAVGKGAKGAAKIAGKAADVLVPGASELVKIPAKKAGEVVTSLINYVRPEIRPEFEQAVQVALKNNINPELLPAAVKYRGGTQSTISKMERVRAQGITGEPYFLRHQEGLNQVRNAVDNKIAELSPKPLSPTEAGENLRDQYNQIVDQFFKNNEITYDTAWKQVPGLQFGTKELDNINSVIEGARRQATRMVQRGATPEIKGQGARLLSIIDNANKVANTGNYKQAIEVMRELGDVGFKRIQGVLPENAAIHRDLYRAFSDAAINTAENRLGKDFSNELIKRNEGFTQFFNTQKQLGLNLNDANIPGENVFRNAIESGNSKTIRALKEIFKNNPQGLNDLKAAYLEKLKTIDKDGGFSLSALRRAMDNNPQVKRVFSELFSEEEAKNIYDLAKLGDDFGPPILNVSGTDVSKNIRGLFRSAPEAISQDWVIEALKRSAKIPPGMTGVPPALLPTPKQAAGAATQKFVSEIATSPSQALQTYFKNIYPTRRQMLGKASQQVSLINQNEQDAKKNSPISQAQSTLQKVGGSPYEAPLRQAMQRGPDSFASTYYILHQSDPKFRALVKEDENQ